MSELVKYNCTSILINALIYELTASDPVLHFRVHKQVFRHLIENNLVDIFILFVLRMHSLCAESHNSGARCEWQDCDWGCGSRSPAGCMSGKTVIAAAVQGLRQVVCVARL